MLPHRTQIFTWLLICWQLLLPSGAPWLHTMVDGSCCATSNPQPASTPCCQQHHSHCADSHAKAKSDVADPDDRDLPTPDSLPHDCSNCVICQAIAAPRALASVIELPAFSELTEIVSVIGCADPLLGFGLPLQCRAPPVG
jgi:hypothetical protein